MTAQLAGNEEQALTHFRNALPIIEALQDASVDYAEPYVALGEVLAGLGDSQGAVLAARRRMELKPRTADAVRGPSIQKDVIFRVLIPAGEFDSAIEQLDDYLSAPGAEWKIDGLLPDPRLDPIRDDPRFVALVERYQRQ